MCRIRGQGPLIAPFRQSCHQFIIVVRLLVFLAHMILLTVILKNGMRLTYIINRLVHLAVNSTLLRLLIQRRDTSRAGFFRLQQQNELNPFKFFSKKSTYIEKTFSGIWTPGIAGGMLYNNMPARSISQHAPHSIALESASTHEECRQLLRASSSAVQPI